MKKVRFLSSIVVLLLASVFVLSSCTKNNKDKTSSGAVSSEITASENVTSVPEKETESSVSKPEVSSKPQVSSNSSKPSTSTKPSVSSKPSTSSKPSIDLPIELPTPIPTPKPTPIPTPTPDPEPTPQPTPDTESTSDPNQKIDAQIIIGKWQTAMDMSKDMIESGFSVTGPCNIIMTYEFTSSNTVIATLDEESFKAVFRPVIEQMLAQMIAEQYQMTLEQFAAENGTTSDELIDTTLDMSLIGSLQQISEYKIDQSGIHIKETHSDQYILYTYQLNGENELILTLDGEALTFTRIN